MQGTNEGLRTPASAMTPPPPWGRCRQLPTRGELGWETDCSHGPPIRPTADHSTRDRVCSPKHLTQGKGADLPLAQPPITAAATRSLHHEDPPRPGTRAGHPHTLEAGAPGWGVTERSWGSSAGKRRTRIWCHWDEGRLDGGGTAGTCSRLSPGHLLPKELGRSDGRGCKQPASPTL